MEQERHLMQSLEELRDDLKGFIETRYEMLRAELSAAIKKAQAAALLIGAGAVLGMLGLMLLGFCVSIAIGLAFGAFTNQVGLVWGFLITGGGCAIMGGMLAGAGIARLKTADLAPRRTMRVLQRDQEFLRQQGGQQYGESTRKRA